MRVESHAAARAEAAYVHGIRANLSQFIRQMIQVFFVGLMIGMERTALPVLAGQDFGVPEGSFLYLMSFVLSFGLVKGALNFVAGRLSERIGRKSVLLLGWAAAGPIPFLLYYAPSWGWVVAANAFLGVNQGLAWTMTVTSKVDISRTEQRGFATGVNEFSGYAAVALAGIAIGYLSESFGVRTALLGFALGVIAVGIVTAAVFIRETLPWARAESGQHANGTYRGHRPRFPQGVPEHPSAAQVFALVSFRHPTFAALCQAGVANKIGDALLWVLFPLLLHGRGLSVVQIGWVTGVYGLVWGASQLWTGPLSDAIGRKAPIVAGLWVLAIGVVAAVLATSITGLVLAAVVMGTGMALLYPTLIAAVADISHPNWRSSALGTYRYWRDTGYAIGAVLLGAVAQLGSGVEATFWFTAAALGISGTWVALIAEETHPRLNPARRPGAPENGA